MSPIARPANRLQRRRDIPASRCSWTLRERRGHGLPSLMKSHRGSVGVHANVAEVVDCQRWAPGEDRKRRATEQMAARGVPAAEASGLLTSLEM
jgi:hypothetical protein